LHAAQRSYMPFFVAWLCRSAHMKLWGFRLSGAFLLSAPAGWNNSELNNLFARLSGPSD